MMKSLATSDLWSKICSSIGTELCVLHLSVSPVVKLQLTVFVVEHKKHSVGIKWYVFSPCLTTYLLSHCEQITIALTYLASICPSGNCHNLLPLSHESKCLVYVVPSSSFWDNTYLNITHPCDYFRKGYMFNIFHGRIFLITRKEKFYFYLIVTKRT